ncbi:MAG TPA: HAMP domain-containing sensor histidine kinase [Thermoanaerobaculia bacterium]
MRRLFRRSMYWFLPVVIIPLGGLLVMQYRTLRTLEQKSVSAERNWQRNAIEAVASDVDERFRRDAEKALALSHVQLLSFGTLGKHFREHPVPGARRFFTLEFHDHRYVSRMWSTNGVETKGHDWSEAEAIKLATMGWHMAYRWGRVAQPALQTDERDRKHRIILRPVVDESMRVVGVAGVMLDPKWARKKISAIAATSFKERFPKRAMTVRVGDDLPRMTGTGREFITQPLSFVFTDWRVGIRDACASPEELAASSFRHNMMWSGGAFMVLLGAIGLAGGAVARQARLSQMKSDFVSNVSHELRTPLSSIRVFGEYMRLGRVTKPEKILEYGEYIEAESRRLTQLINNILDFSKIESAEKNYRFCATDVVELAGQTVAGFEMPLREAGVTIAFSASGPRPPLLQLDKDAIAQVLVNLLDNAVKYSNGNKNIDVTVLSAGDEVRVSVRDRGIGIPVLERKKIFDKFYRVGSGLVHDVKGSGLGLPIVEHVAKAHGGHVEVESELGAGSTFTIVLPVPAADRAVAMTQELA